MSSGARLTALSAQNFKSIGQEPQGLTIRPLTILAGANSSGKSTLLQPCLLLKQTYESSFDPAGLLLDGVNVRLSDTTQLLSLVPGAAQTGFRWGFELDHDTWIHLEFDYLKKRGLRMTSVEYQDQQGAVGRISSDELDSAGPTWWSLSASPRDKRDLLELEMKFRSALTHVVHVQGVRSTPQRNYPRTSARDPFPGTFEPYTASLIQNWQDRSDSRIASVRKWLNFLGLTNALDARQSNDVTIELRVGRLPSSRSKRGNDMVSIADVGFGVSQVLPVLVALLAAGENGMVYIEQPELHLHPNPQVKLAHILVEASRRGPSVVVETHSALLLREIQTLVAQGELDPANVSLNWCSRNSKTGATVVSQAELTKDGTYGDWPIDFDNIAMDSERRFLDSTLFRTSS